MLGRAVMEVVSRARRHAILESDTMVVAMVMAMLKLKFLVG
jgi:hypothetical protein